MKIIIDYPNDMDTQTALNCIQEVVDGGRLSKIIRGGIEREQYCFVTLFSNGIIVFARDKTTDTTDSFRISYDPPKGE